MFWDRFNICEAYYVYAMLNHGGQWSKEYALFATLNRMKFKPASSLAGPDDLEENARSIYEALVLNPKKVRDRR